LYSSLINISIIKLRMMRWTCRVACVGKMLNLYKILVRKHEDKRALILTFTRCSKYFNWAPRHGGILGNGGVAPWILNLSSGWSLVVSFTPRPVYVRGKGTRYPFDGKPGGLQIRSGRGTGIKNLCPCRESNHCRPARSLFTILRCKVQINWNSYVLNLPRV